MTTSARRAQSIGFGDDEQITHHIGDLEPAGNFVDPRQKDLPSLRVGVHYPLRGYGFYMLEPNTTSSLLTVPILSQNDAFIARHLLYASLREHPTGHDWPYNWERWQVFRTDLPPDNNNNLRAAIAPSSSAQEKDKR
jgi:hypothetical protein